MDAMEELESYGLASCPCCRCKVTTIRLPGGRAVMDPPYLHRRMIASLVGPATMAGWGQAWGLICNGTHECPPEDLADLARERTGGHDVRRN